MISISLDKPTNSVSSISTMDLDLSRDDDLFNPSINLSKSSVTAVVKERRESKEKNKRELEEEEREKMQ